MSGFVLAILSYHLNDTHLQQLIQPSNSLPNAQDIIYRFVDRGVRQEHKRIPFASRVSFRAQKRGHELCSIRNEVFEFAMDGVESEDGVLPDVRMPVFEARATCRDQGF
jgi:hypothetical protein